MPLTAFCTVFDAGVLEAIGATVGCAGLFRQSRARSIGGAAENTGCYTITIGRRVVRNWLPQDAGPPPDEQLQILTRSILCRSR